MLEKLLLRLFEELEMGNCPPKDAKGCYPIELGENQTVFCQDTGEHFLLRADVAPLPEEKQEELCTHLMTANFLGQGTGSSILGLDETEKTLTLSSVLPYEVDYPLFKERLEEFANYLGYWQEELIGFAEEA